MGGKVATLGEPLLTVAKPTNVRFLSSVGSVVSPEVKIERELLPTEVTSERLLTSVNELVSLQL
jgi:hypothetical protein